MQHEAGPPAMAADELPPEATVVDSPAGQDVAASSPSSSLSPDRSFARELFVSLAELSVDDPRRQTRPRRARRACTCRSSSTSPAGSATAASRYDDLVQVATIGLIKSVDRFDLERGVEFSTYATPTIVGEIKRHFRDKGWAVRVPRRLQELRLSLTSATGELSQKQGRAPTVARAGRRTWRSPRRRCSRASSRRTPTARCRWTPATRSDDESPPVSDTLGVEDEALEGVEYRESLKPLLEQLPPREKKILLLRFFGNMTQSRDRRRDRHLADARLPAARPHPGPAPRGPARRGVGAVSDRARPQPVAVRRVASSWSDRRALGQEREEPHPGQRAASSQPTCSARRAHRARRPDQAAGDRDDQPGRAPSCRAQPSPPRRAAVSSAAGDQGHPSPTATPREWTVRSTGCRPGPVS